MISTPIDSVERALETLGRLPTSHVPIVSLYLNLEPDAHGKDNYAPFVRKELADRAHAAVLPPELREGVDRDIERIQQYLAGGVPAAANGLAIFASDGRAGFFEALLLDVPVDRHRVTISPVPHLYPLALLLDRHPRHAVALIDSHVARVLVFGLGHPIAAETVEGEKIRRSSGGGWAQARYQRRIEQLQAAHARELVEELERIVRDEGIDRVLLAGDDVNLALVRRELPPELAGKVVDVLTIESRAAESEVMKAAAEALRRHDAHEDETAVSQLLDEYNAGGLAEAGLEKTAEALAQGRVDTLYLTVPGSAGAVNEDAADELVSRALQISARTRFIEDSALLTGVGGVAARLRYQIAQPATE